MKFKWKSKKRGQSIPIIALMILVLFGMVGLSVDVGNTYAEQRNVVRAADAAALAGMQKMLQSRKSGEADTDVARIIKASLKSNGLRISGANDVAPEERNVRRLTMTYLDAEGDEITSCQVGGCGEIPQDVKYIKVSLSGVVDTYFARVVGRQTLPVAATSHSGYCAPKDNVFPLAVSEGSTKEDRFPLLTDETGYAPAGYTGGKLSGPYKEDAQYSYTFVKANWRRLFLTSQVDDNVKPYELRLLSWRGTEKASSAALRAAFTGVGTMAGGITEARWPEDGAGGWRGGTRPDVYPVEPEQLDKDEWLHGYGETPNSVSPSNWDAIRAEMSKRIQNRDVLILPIVAASTYADPDHNGYMRYKVLKLGLFRIANGSSGIDVNSQYMYMDLAYLGDFAGSPCLLQAPAKLSGTEPPAVMGLVQVKPVFKDSQGERQPISYQVVLDVSGSMVADIYGHAHYKGKAVMCMNGMTSPPEYNLPYEPNCNVSASDNVNSARWNIEKDRRIYLAKDAINKLIDGMETDKGDTLRLIVFSDDLGVDKKDNTKVFPSDGWSKDKVKLKQELLKAGSVGGDPYLTKGTTPTPQGLNTTLKLLQSPTAPDEYDNGTKKLKYKKVVILVTDGMANVFLDGQKNQAEDLPDCVALKPQVRVFNTIDCQKGLSTLKKYGGQFRPLDQMVDVAKKIKALDENLELYVIAMAVSPYGLRDGVASSPNTFYPANEPDAVKNAIAAVQQSVKKDECFPRTDGEFLDQVGAGNVTTGFGYASGVYGKVIITSSSNTTFEFPIVQNDQTGGKLGWIAPKGSLAAGTYTIQVQVGYKHDKDGEERRYNKIVTSGDAYADSTSFTVVGSDLGTMHVVDTLQVNFDPGQLKMFCPKTEV